MPASDAAAPSPSSSVAALASEEALLELEARDERGRPARGTVWWTTTPAPPLTPPFLASEVELPNAVPRRARIDGVGRIAVPAGSWTWAFFACDPPVVAGRFLRAPPFRGRQRHRLDLDPERRSVHVFVLDATLAEPARHLPIEVLGIDAQSGQATPSARCATDDHGYACIEGLSPGHALVRLAGVESGAGGTQEVRLALLRGVPPLDVPVVLVAPEVRQALTLRVRGPAGWQPRLPVLPYLQRMDDGTGTVVPVQMRLSGGVQEQQVALAPGFWRFGALPVGASPVVGGQDLVRIDASTTVVDVQVAPAEATWLGLRRAGGRDPRGGLGPAVPGAVALARGTADRAAAAGAVPARGPRPRPAVGIAAGDCAKGGGRRGGSAPGHAVAGRLDGARERRPRRCDPARRGQRPLERARCGASCARSAARSSRP